MERTETVIINTLAKSQVVDTDRLQAHVAKALDLLGAEMGEVGIVLTTDDHVKTLNSRYRAVNSPTDVLSFPLRKDNAQADPPMPGHPQDGDLPPLGDIIISVETAARQALERNHATDDEVTFLALHGLLHLMGIHHDTERDAEYREKIDILTNATLGRSIPH